MILHHNPKYVTLYYRSLHYRKSGWAFPEFPRQDEYYPVVSYPRTEMTGDSAQYIADDFITLTNAPQWRMRSRRAVEPGDLFTHAPSTYMFIEPSATHTIPANAQLVEQPQTWTHLHIVRLSVDWSHMRELCTQ